MPYRDKRGDRTWLLAHTAHFRLDARVLVVIGDSLFSQAMNTSASEKQRPTLWRPT